MDPSRDSSHGEVWLANGGETKECWYSWHRARTIRQAVEASALTKRQKRIDF